MAIAYGGGVPKRGRFVIYRFANKIPLLYDEASDVSYRVISAMNWRRYKVSPDMPIAIVVHICSTKVPYKTVGKEFIADRPEVRREEANALREVARQLQHFLSRKNTFTWKRNDWAFSASTCLKSHSFQPYLLGKKRFPILKNY